MGCRSECPAGLPPRLQGQLLVCAMPGACCGKTFWQYWSTTLATTAAGPECCMTCCCAIGCASCKGLCGYSLCNRLAWNHSPTSVARPLHCAAAGVGLECSGHAGPRAPHHRTQAALCVRAAGRPHRAGANGLTAHMNADSACTAHGRAAAEAAALTQLRGGSDSMMCSVPCATLPCA